MSEMQVALWPTTMKVEAAVRNAAQRLPGDVGNALLQLVEPQALATMLGVLTLWSGSHFFGVGEIADIILLTLGWLAVGGAVFEAASNLYNFATRALNARSNDDIKAAGAHLATAVTLLGVQTALALLTRSGPKSTFKTAYKGQPLGSLSQMGKLPRSAGPFYKPKIRFRKDKLAGQGATNAAGDTWIGRDHYGPGKAAAQEVRKAAYHEAMHRFLTPKLQIFREFRVYLKQSGYSKSYVLRYLEEALCEIWGQLRGSGFGKDEILAGLKFPLGTKYEITIALLGEEAKGILLGPITVGGMVYTVYQGERTEVYEQGP
jgi:hypothetical protein